MMSFEQRIANIKALPLRDRPREQIEHAVRVLDSISYHNASEMTGEWALSNRLLTELCEWFVKNRWKYGEVYYLLDQGGPFLCDRYSVFHRFVATLYKAIPDDRNS
jgi:hypothetical protein